MRKKFVQVLVVALAAFAVLTFAYPDDDLSDDDFGSLMLQQSSVKIATSPGPANPCCGLPGEPLRLEQKYAVSKLFREDPSSTLLSLAACVLRC